MDGEGKLRGPKKTQMNSEVLTNLASLDFKGNIQFTLQRKEKYVKNILL